MVSRLDYCKIQQSLTDWRAKGKHDQQAKIAARQHRYLLPEVPRTSMINRLELQQGTHFLKRHRQASSAKNVATRPHSYSQTEGTRKYIISRLKLQQNTTATHILESQGQT